MKKVLEYIGTCGAGLDKSNVSFCCGANVIGKFGLSSNRCLYFLKRNREIWEKYIKYTEKNKIYIRSVWVENNLRQLLKGCENTCTLIATTAPWQKPGELALKRCGFKPVLKKRNRGSTMITTWIYKG